MAGSERKADLSSTLKKWASGKISLGEIKGYSSDELYAIAHTAYFFLMQGRNKEARVLFEGLVALDPYNDYYYRALGVIFHRIGEEEAAQLRGPEDAKTSSKGGRTFSKKAEAAYQKACQRALKQFGYAIKVNKRSAAAYVNRGEINIALEQYDAASEDLRRALSLLGPRDNPRLVRKTRTLLRVAGRRGR